MAKIERKTQKIFAGNAATDELAVFGSMISGTPVYNDDIEALQSEAYTEGWKAAVAANEAPFMEEMNAVQYGFSKQLAYLFQEGIPEWDAETEYSSTGLVKSLDSNKIKLYRSLKDGNVGHLVSEPNWWEEVKLGGYYSLPLFSFMWSDHLLNDIQYLRADTFSWQDGNTYSLAYDKLVQEYATGEEVTEDGITFKRSANGFKIADATQEQAILELYNRTGVAWFYLLDTPNTRFKLPRTKYSFVGLRDNVGNFVTESLPNIKAKTTVGAGVWGLNLNPTGALYGSDNSQSFNPAKITTENWKSTLNLDLSRASSTYQDNAPVQQRATQMYLYFYVGGFTQTAIEQTAGLNAELFNNKMDRDMSNRASNNPFVTETYQNGTSGYRLWSDGYCEQWGRISVGLDASVSVTFLKPFMNASYYANWISCNGYTQNGEGTRACDNLTTTSMRIYNGQDRAMLANWYACGY